MSAEEKTNEDLTEAEGKNGKLEIIKQIKKVNDDGSYTIGYEADDGSFKIESRDVLGNIKGTYGYIDEQGDIKRVSYSSTNKSEMAIKPEPPSVVQRIPRTNRTNATTRRPFIVYPNLTTISPVSTTTVIQAIPRRRTTISTTTSTTTPTPSTPSSLFLSTTSPVRILATSRPILRSTVAPQLETFKEGQLDRPDVPSYSTEGPYYRKPTTKNTLLDNDSGVKPVTEEEETRSNVLRRQLSTEKPFDSRQHVLNLQQGMGQDSVDVYGSVTTGTQRPLFTTTSRPKMFSTPTIRYNPYQPPQEPATEAPSLPVVQIPANKETPEYVHPFHRGAVFIPINQFVPKPPIEETYQPRYIVKENPSTEQPVFIRRPYLRPIPVQVDENGFIREFSSPPPPQQRFLFNKDAQEDIDQIKPPVSTREFQRLLEHLIVRQDKLEQLSMLANGRIRPSPYPTMRVRNEPVQYIQSDIRRPVYNTQYYTPTPESLAPTRRVTRLQPDETDEDNFLPSDVREMLLLKMLQLAINPSLPLDMDSMQEASSLMMKKAVRNVEILGEVEEEKDLTRKRYRNTKSY